MKKHILQLFLLILVLGICWNFGLAADENPDYWPTKSWRTTSPERQGMDSNLLKNMMDLIWEKDLAIDSILLVRNGYIVLDAYSYPGDAEHKHNVFSCTKSVMSALIGIAIDKGYIKGVNQPVLEFFPLRKAENFDANKEAMTLEHVLVMATGLECRDSYRYYWKGLHEMSQSADWVQFMIDLPMVEPPGTRFEYCNGASLLLSAILQQPTSMNTLTFRRRGLRGMPGFAVLVDDIPPSITLENSAEYLIKLYNTIPQITDPEIKKQERITLSDGTDANYFQVSWKYQSIPMQTVGVIAYTNSKLIGVVAGSVEETPVEYLAGMVKSLRFVSNGD